MRRDPAYDRIRALRRYGEGRRHEREPVEALEAPPWKPLTEWDDAGFFTDLWETLRFHAQHAVLGGG